MDNKKPQSMNDWVKIHFLLGRKNEVMTQRDDFYDVAVGDIPKPIDDLVQTSRNYTVWAVELKNMDGEWIDQLFSTEEKALDYVRKQGRRWSIIEWRLDKGIVSKKRVKDYKN